MPAAAGQSLHLCCPDHGLGWMDEGPEVVASQPAQQVSQPTTNRLMGLAGGCAYTCSRRASPPAAKSSPW